MIVNRRYLHYNYLSHKKCSQSYIGLPRKITLQLGTIRILNYFVYKHLYFKQTILINVYLKTKNVYLIHKCIIRTYVIFGHREINVNNVHYFLIYKFL